MSNAFQSQGLKSAVYGLLIVATVVVFVVQFRPGAQGKTGSIKQDCAAEIRGTCIEPKEFFAELMLAAPGRMIEASRARKMGLRRTILDGLVERTLLVQDAERLGLTIAEQELDDELATGRAHISLPVDRARPLAYSLRITEDGARILPVLSPDTKAFDYKVYDRVVRQYTNRSPTEFKAMQRLEMLAQRMRDLVRARVRVGEQEAWSVYQREKATVTIRFAALRREWFARHAIDASPAAVEAWARQHEEEVSKTFEGRKAQYLPECRAARHILVKVPEGATDDQKAEARKKIDLALQRIERKEDFAAVARQVSEDTSAAEGGDLGCFQRGRMVKPFEDAVFGLEVGAVSAVVETHFGLHIIKLDAIHKDAAAEAVGRRDTAKALMVSHETEAIMADVAKKVLASVKAGKKLDEALAEALPARVGSKPAATGSDDQETGRPKVEVSAPLTLGGEPISGVAPGQNVVEMAMRLEKDGDTPDDLIKLEDGYAVIQLKDKSQATKEQFEKEKDWFVEQMLMAKQADELNGYVARLREANKAAIKVNEAYAKEAEKEQQGNENEEEQE
jgi:peptidyl-prolyl cis-trans isomerase D